MAASFPKNLPELYKIEIDYVLSSEHLDEDNTSQFTDTKSSLSTPTAPKTPVIPLNKSTKKKLEKDNKLARSYLLNNMSNPLFDLFVNFKSAKIIWTKLEAKYGSDDAGKRKYVIGKWR